MYEVCVVGKWDVLVDKDQALPSPLLFGLPCLMEV